MSQNEIGLSRRKFLRALAGTAAVGATAKILPAVQAKSNPKRKPNVVLIMADDIGYECFGCYGGKSYKTPRIDKLADKGMLFKYCYSQPLCTPSRVKIMTGRSNIRNYKAFALLDKKEKTFGNLMKQAGYATGVFGKWQLYGAEHTKPYIRGKGITPKKAGFDKWCLWHYKKYSERYWKPAFDVNGKRVDFTGKYGPDVLLEKAVEFIDENKDKPFFLYYPMVLVHNPFLPTPDSKNKRSRNRQKNFADMVAYMDKIVGKLRDKIVKAGLAEDTIFMFTGDNGTNSEIKSRVGAKVVRGGKGLMHEFGTHVPLVATWDKTTPAGSVCEDLVDFSDFLPTICQAGGAVLPENVTYDGKSFLPQLMGKKGNPRKWYFCYYNSRPTFKRQRRPSGAFARDQRYKLYTDGRFFDCKKDPLEKSELDKTRLTSQAKTALTKLRKAIKSMPAKPQNLMSRPAK